MPTNMESACPTVAVALARVTRRQFLDGRRAAVRFAGAVQKHLIPRWGERVLTTLGSEEIEEYAVELRTTYQPATINFILHPLRAAFKLYAKELHIPVPDIILLEVRNAREVFFEREEFERVVAELPAPLRPPFWFAFHTGWRTQSEILPLQWSENVRWNAGLIVLPAAKTKGDQYRKFPFDALPELTTLLERQQATTPAGCPWVFSRFGGKRIRKCYEAWHNAVHRAQLDCDGRGEADACSCRRVPHDLRRTAARNLRDAGVSDDLIMQLVGWRTITMLYRYLGKAREKDLRGAVGKLAG